MPEITDRKIDVSYKDIAKIINDQLIGNLIPPLIRLKYDYWIIDSGEWVVYFYNETPSGNSYLAMTYEMGGDMIEKYKAIKYVVKQLAAI